MPAGPGGCVQGVCDDTVVLSAVGSDLARGGRGGRRGAFRRNKPGRLVFWRGHELHPHWVTENGIWYTNEFNETWGNMRGSGRADVRQAMPLLAVQILESGEARAVVHWRYALTDVYYQIARADPATGWGDWSDEIFC